MPGRGLRCTWRGRSGGLVQTRGVRTVWGGEGCDGVCGFKVKQLGSS